MWSADVIQVDRSKPKPRVSERYASKIAMATERAHRSRIREPAITGIFPATRGYRSAQSLFCPSSYLRGVQQIAAPLSADERTIDAKAKGWKKCMKINIASCHVAPLSPVASVH
jgi:hypothetical protein